MTNLSILQGELLKGMGAANRIHQIIASKAVIPIRGGNVLSSVKGTRKFPENSLHLGTIEFKNVQFVYPSRPHVRIFDGLNFKLDEGKVYALVGPSGSGKSTIAALIERFYDPNHGEILMDGVNIATLDPSWLRRNIAIVSQEPVLFGTSIAENISFGKNDATKEEIERAAKLANAHDFIANFPGGNTIVVMRYSEFRIQHYGRRERCAAERWTEAANCHC
jgi:ABC-type multidrug transport system fused ATPase/permease subunit